MQLSHAVIHVNCLKNEQPRIFTLAVPSNILNCLGIQNALDPLQSLILILNLTSLPDTALLPNKVSITAPVAFGVH